MSGRLLECPPQVVKPRHGAEAVRDLSQNGYGYIIHNSTTIAKTYGQTMHGQNGDEGHTIRRLGQAPIEIPVTRLLAMLFYRNFTKTTTAFVDGLSCALHQLPSSVKPQELPDMAPQMVM